MKSENVIFRPTPKQYQALEKLNDDITEELLFGGGASGGKSVLGCYWLISNCLQYPGVRYLLGRAVLKNLKQTTVKTLLRLMGSTPSKHNEVRFNMVKDKDYKYNTTDGEIKFNNGSEIIFKDLKLEPSDLEFDSLGSLEITGAFLDEVSQIPIKAKEIILTRCRHMTQEYKLIPKVLYCTNPAKHWAYQEFYKPWREKTIGTKRCFIQALVTDNKYSDPNYVESLKRRDKNTRERLLHGNWEYDDDPSILCEYDAICDIFTNTFVEEGEKYISTDLAMQGRDKFVIGSWSGLRCKIPVVKPKCTGKEIESDIKKVSLKDDVPRSHIVGDSDGMGNYLSSYLEGMREFHGGKAAKNTKEYFNLRSECGFKLAEVINARKIYIQCDDIVIKGQIIAELEQLKRDKVDNDEMKKRLIKKDLMKENLGGKSPDFFDMLMMRMLFLIDSGRMGFLSDPENLMGLG